MAQDQWGREMDPDALYPGASTEPLEIIRSNECNAQQGLATSRFQALWNEIIHLRRIVSAYVDDENRFNRGEGEAYGSISTETGMRARAAINPN